ncbi:hypothetical protein SDC9_200660 [bioreactor metagenome]|uniref:Uncharacterized protein n=1 Tax=bioreactor metagenome TaxID=1076179 RepID=A0A645IP32_9ZZZZ
MAPIIGHHNIQTQTIPFKTILNSRNHYWFGLAGELHDAYTPALSTVGFTSILYIPQSLALLAYLIADSGKPVRPKCTGWVTNPEWIA